MLPIVVLLALQAPSPAPAGRYVESRTAAVFAGACHYNGEYCTEGREALCVWHFDQGSAQGFDLGGLDIALSLRADQNLAEPNAAVRRGVYLPQGADESRCQAALELLAQREPALFAGAQVLGRIPLEARFGADGSYAVEGGATLSLRGATLPDRACCKMPFDVWYAPFGRIEGQRVGDNQVFSMHDARLGRVFDRPGDNAAITGTFRFE